MAQTALHAEPAFHVTGKGENFAVEYDPGYTGNIVGGGDRIARQLTGDATQAEYANPVARQAPGTPVFRGGREGDVVYLPGIY
ncbi:hypothetical protein HMPREF9946_03466 [Acetobacteraceae bacterium AT-5844]|nr:hypothetical protein HMPREF9946_03466 [Acetobacteraceae bacterium AT-5844]